MTAASRSPSARVAPRLMDAALSELVEGAPPGDLELASALFVDSPDGASVAGRERLLAALDEVHRFDDLEAQVARLLDIEPREAGRFLLEIDRGEVWEEGPHPGCQLFHVRGGPQVADAVTGFVRIAPRSHFPEHEHLGGEAVLVLQGALCGPDGVVVRAGEIATMPAGSSHAFDAVGDLPLIYLAVIEVGVVIAGARVLAGDPRA